MHTFFARLSRMKYINRWGLMRNTITENIAEHSLDVAVIAHALAVIGNTYFDKDIPEDRVAVLALFHDSTEIITGDMPTPIKYFAPEIRDAYKKVEHVAADELLTGLPEELQNGYRDILQSADEEKSLWKYVKAADKLSAYVKCLEEISMGNGDFNQAKETIYQILIQMQMEEVDYFMEKFIPAYSLTFDEQV